MIQRNFLKFQRGALVLVISLILLFVCLLVSVFTATAITSHQKITNNQNWGSQAFEAAEGGLNFANAYINTHQTTMVVDTNADGYINPNPSPLTSATMATPISTGTFSVQITNPIQNNFNILRITSTGTSLDGTNKVITQLYGFVTTLHTFPQAPITALRNVNISGNVTIANTAGNTTIISGGTTSLGGAASTHASNGVTSNKNGLHSDVSQNAFPSTLTSDQFFVNFFGTTQSVVKNSAQYYYSASADTNYSTTLSGLVDTTIWLDQTGGSAIFNSNTTIGSATQPVVLIVNGNLKLNGNLVLYGIVYVTGDWVNNGGGTATIIGSAAVGGNFTSTGTPNITYSPVVQNNNKKVGLYVPIPGTWKDF